MKDLVDGDVNKDIEQLPKDATFEAGRGCFFLPKGSVPIDQLGPHKPGEYIEYTPVPDLPPDPKWKELRRILDLALDQASKGKGIERHGQDGLPWHEQPIIRNQLAFGNGFALGQASKKMEESQGLDKDHALHEILGAIVYAAGAYYYREQQEK